MRVAGAATTDSLGQYRLGPVRPGSYLAGFMHAALVTRGVDQVTMRVQVPPAGAVRLDFAAPRRRAGGDG
jgi:hypothetical protein